MAKKRLFDFGKSEETEVINDAAPPPTVETPPIEDTGTKIVTTAAVTAAAKTVPVPSQAQTYKVSARSAFVVNGMVSYLDPGAIVSTATHDIAEMKGQGVALEPCVVSSDGGSHEPQGLMTDATKIDPTYETKLY